MKTVAQRWAEFEQEVIPRVGEIQRKEMRRAFYAGFYSALVAGLEMAAESGPDDQLGCEMMNAMHVECRRFAADVMTGFA